MTSYHNTNNEQGVTLAKSNAKAKTQENAILAYFGANPLEEYTAEEIHAKTLLGCPLTSIRRAMTNLAEKGELVKTNHMATGMYGKMIYKWKLNFK